MKILFTGIFSDPASTNIQMARIIRKGNHKVISFDYQYNTKEINQLYRRFLTRIEKSKYSICAKLSEINRFYLFGNWDINRQLLHEVKKNSYDLVILPKTPSINYHLIPKLNKYSKTWYFFMDPLHQALRINAQKYASLSTWSSATFSSVNNLFKREGANCHHITEGFNPAVFNPGKVHSLKSIDIIFVGSISPKRKKFIDFLRDNNINVTAFGPGWENKSIYIEDLSVKYRDAKIILNFTRGNVGFSDRVFHALGSRSLLISEYCRDLEKFFKKGVHLEWFKSPEELLELIRLYINDNNLREKIANQGYDFAIENFTWEKIVEKIFTIVQNKK